MGINIQRPAGVNVTVVNPNDVLYVKGDADTDESWRMAIPGTPPVRCDIEHRETLNESNFILDEAKVTEIEAGGFTSENPFFGSVLTDSRVDQTTPTGLNGDMTGRVIEFDGFLWRNYLDQWVTKGSFEERNSTTSADFDSLQDVDLTGAADNDLLYRSGSLWIDTAGALTWDGTNLSATQFGGIPEADLVDKSAPETIAGLWTMDAIVPTLAGNLNVNGNKIISTSNGDIDIEPNGTGNVLLGNMTFEASQTIGVPQDQFVLTYDDAVGTIRLVAASGGSEVNDLTAVVTWANVPNANITAGSVTQHEAALTILESQITDGTLLARLAANETIAGLWTHSGRLVTDDSTTARAGFNIPTGVAPTSPVQGDIWVTTADAFIQVNGVSESLLNVAEINDLSAVVTWANVPDANITQGSVTQHEGAIDHDALLNFDVNEHFLQSAISIPASQISDFDTEVSNNASVVANTVKATNATHTGDVTGSGALTIDPAAISGKALVTAIATDEVLLLDATDGQLKRADVGDFLGGGGGGDKTYRIGHTYGIISKVKVPSGQKDFIIPFFVSLASGQTVKLVKARHIINDGTSVTCKLQKNGSDITGFTGISVTTTAADTDPTDVTLANNDKLALVVTGIAGTPQNMSFTIFIEYTA